MRQHPSASPVRAVGAAEALWGQHFEAQATALSPDTVDAFAALYAPDAVFSDPFHTLRGRESIAAAYRAMFQSLVKPGFSELALAWVDADRVAVYWRFRFRLSAKATVTDIPGTSWLCLDPDSRLITAHEDHWDASAFFGAFPGLRSPVRWLKSRVAHAGSVTRKP